MNRAAAPAAAHAVRVVNVTHRYRGKLALDGVSLDVAAGTTVGLIGPDGVGKSSLLALIAGARRIQSGAVSVLGGDMRSKAHRERICARIAYMPQGLGRNLTATLTVRENLEFFGRLFGHARAERAKRIDELLAATGLAPFPDRPVVNLSGGMKQKLGLCCALIHDPDLLLLDEPTTGVDPLSRRQFWELIDRIRARRPRMSVLVATAYIEEAERFDRMVALDEGRILAADTPAALKARTATASLEEAFIALLPERKRDRHRAFVVPPRRADREIAIEAKALTRRFGGFVAVDSVSFGIRRGEIFGFVGSNGCGKTTTMKMLTAMLPASEGEARLFGKPVDARDLATRRRVGFMSQSFSLYTELTVRQNLELHARLFHLPAAEMRARIHDLVSRFGLEQYTDEVAETLPLGVRQRLSLAVALIHGPELLILDEPTSGVDPVARDRFWELLIDLSRNRGVTIFISTHFMNEAQRCDRVALMHAGKVLAQDTPAALARTCGAPDLEQAFIAYLEQAQAVPASGEPALPAAHGGDVPDPGGFSPGRFWAYFVREAKEIRRDPIRLAFALLGPMLLMIVFGYGISFDVENLTYAVLDQDNTPESRAYLENFAGSRYFRQQRPILDARELEERMGGGTLKIAIEIPPGFGRDLRRGRRPEVSVWLDGAVPFRAETSRSYIEGVHQKFLADRARAKGLEAAVLPADIVVRLRYNQDFQSVYAMVPGIIMMLLAMIPAMMTALGVVREKELGSIVNLYVTPVTKLEFVFGKQLPYVIVAAANFVCLLLLALLLFQVPVKGSFAGLVAGVALYVIGTTGFGMLVSSFVRTQIAAIFAVAILTSLTAIQFSGFLVPVSSLSPDARAMGLGFPSTYFQHASVGTFTKALPFRELTGDLFSLAALAVAYLALGVAVLRKQER